MIKVVYTILAIRIKDMEICLSNSSLRMGKNISCFRFLAQKEEIDKQTADALYYQ